MLVWMLVMACSGPVGEAEAEPSAPTPEASAADDEALAKADATAANLAKTLQSRMLQEMGAGGPPEALEACSQEAGDLTAAAATAEAPDARAGRASLRLRNHANSGPDWVTAWLEVQPEAAKDATPYREVVDTAEGRMARVIKPITIAEPCLSCHGPDATLHPDVKAKLAHKYPEDAATGYGVGDLRGALWAEVPVGGS